MAPAVPTSGQSVQKSGEPESKTAPRQGLKLHHGRELFQQIGEGAPQLFIVPLQGRDLLMLKEPCFKRESDNYLEKYPIVLDLISVFYTWIIPLLIIVINVGKLSMEFRTTSNLWSAIFDTLCCGFTVVLTIMYLVMMHPRYKNS